MCIHLGLNVLEKVFARRGAWSSAAAAPTTAPIKKPKAYFIARSFFTVYNSHNVRSGEVERTAPAQPPILHIALLINRLFSTKKQVHHRQHDHRGRLKATMQAGLGSEAGSHLRRRNRPNTQPPTAAPTMTGDNVGRSSPIWLSRFITMLANQPADAAATRSQLTSTHDLCTPFSSF